MKEEGRKRKTGHHVLIKRNKRQENDEKWLAFAKEYGSVYMPRKGKTVYIGTAYEHPEGKKMPEGLSIAFEVTERTIDSDGTALLIPEIEVSTWWTDLRAYAETAIELYHEHATMEQFHSELKNDMNVERLPSGKFEVNKIILATAVLAFNALRKIGQAALESEKYPCTKEKPQRKRLGKVISDLIQVAGKYIRHAREKIYKICIDNPWRLVFIEIADAISNW
jgi:hypothetical protein